MNSLTTSNSWPIQDSTSKRRSKPRLGGGFFIAVLLGSFLLGGNLIQRLDPTAGILDIGILSVLLFGLLSSAVVIFCSLWLQELLWKPFKTFRKQFSQHLHQLTSWQQCILYFSVFFLWLYALLEVLRILL